jgi:gamma-glutamyltranspeptidase/glutathione hydrolase
MSNWRTRAGSSFETDKQPATASGGMVVSNHHLASLAGSEMLANGGNAIDAAVASLFALTVVEPMMVGIFGGGMSHIRLANGEHVVVEALSKAPLAAQPDLYRPISDTLPNYLETEGRENAVGAKAIAAPGTLAAWCHALDRYGSLPLEDVMSPAIRYAEHGFPATSYLSDCIEEAAEDLANDPTIASVFLADGRPIGAGTRVFQRDYAETLKTIAREGPAAMHGGPIGRAVIDYLTQQGGVLTYDDLTAVQVTEREVVRGSFRGVEVVGPPPPSSGGVHIIQILNILEGFDLKSLGFGSTKSLHLIAEALKIAFSDRMAVTADPAFVTVPVETLISPDYAAHRRQQIREDLAQTWSTEVMAFESNNTTHLTAADRDGNVVAATQTINSTFGARIMIPGVGLIPNNYMYVFDPHPGNTQSIVGGKRVTSSMSPFMAIRDGRPILALGLPGGLRIFGSVMQALVNYIEHEMSVQEIVEAPRIWTQGDILEVEAGIDASVRSELEALGHRVVTVPHVGGGMNAIAINDNGSLTGAACWRADGTAVGIGGGRARADARFWPDAHRA